MKIDRRLVEIQTVCACCDVGGFEAAIAYIGEKDFFYDDTRQAFLAIKHLNKMGEAVDYAKLFDVLTQSGWPPKVEFLQGIVAAAYEASHAEYHARRLRDINRAAALRLKIEPWTRAEIVADADLAEMQESLATLVTDGERGERTLEQVLLSPSLQQSIVSTGFDGLDARLEGGMRTRQLIVVGGRPGAGKTSLMMQIAVQSALYRLTNVLIVTIEMAASELVARWQKSVDTHRLAQLNVRIRDDLDNWRSIEAAIAHNVRKYGTRLVVVDYIQRIGCPDVESRERQIAVISGGLKDLARRHDCVVLAGSQLNREVTKTGKRPGLHDLRESGAIEQDADTVIMLGFSELGDDRRTFDVVKQRNGPTSKADAIFHKAKTWFEECPATEEDPTADADASWRA